MKMWTLLALWACDDKSAPCADGFGLDDRDRCVPLAGDDPDTAAPLNTPPTAPALRVVPMSPRAGGLDATCTVAVESVDLDGDPVVYAWSWNDGAGQSVNGPVLSGSEMTEGEEWTCTATPNDGVADGPSAAVSVPVGAAPSPWMHEERSLSEADYLLTGEAARDGAGGAISRAGDVDGDGRADFLVGAYRNDEAGNSAGKAYLVFGASLGASRTAPLAEADWLFVGENGGGEPPCEDGGEGDPDSGACEGDWTAHSVNTAGDVDGDGLDDILICGYQSDETGFDAGKVYLIPGRKLGADGGRLDLADAPTHFLGENPQDMLGHSVSTAGDVDGDGLADMVMGSYGHDEYAGRVYVVLGGSLEDSQRMNVSEADFTFVGEQAGDEAGYVNALAGDIDGDGLADVLTAALLNQEAGDAEGPTGQQGSGKVYIVTAAELPARGGMLNLADADRAWIAEGSGDLLGYGSMGVGDVDGDGLSDAVLNSFGNDEAGENTGKTYVVTASDMSSAGSRVLSEASYGFVGEQDEQWVGFSASAAGDVDLDGFDDLLVGGFRYSIPSETLIDIGKAYLVRMGLLGGPGTHSLADAHASWVGESEGDAAGYRVSGLGDVNGDGLPDLAVGGWQGDVPTGAGKVWVLLNP